MAFMTTSSPTSRVHSRAHKSEKFEEPSATERNGSTREIEYHRHQLFSIAPNEFDSANGVRFYTFPAPE
jgi:hypothetical protein